MSKTTGGSDKPGKKAPRVVYVKTGALQPEGSEGRCLRPLGLCDLGGCCEVCWYGTANKNASRPSKPA
jgi:hypothetical protein